MRPFLILATVFMLSACSHFGPKTAADETGKAPPAQTMIASDGNMCGGIAGIICNDGSFCKQEDYSCTQVADNAGICEPISQICTREYRPVCGCDGKTYSNKCTAHAAGTSIANDGPCES